MQRTSFADMACSLARSLDVATEWWTPLIVRDVWTGRTRFGEIQENLGISRRLLSDRLGRLVDEGVLTRERYQDRPPRHEYHLTDKGRELMVALLPLLSWGDRWTAAEEGVPMHLRHRGCRETFTAQATCSECGEALDAADVRLEPGPGFRIGRGTELLPERHPFHGRYGREHARDAR